MRPLPHLPQVDLTALGLPLGFPLGGMSLLPSAFLPPPGLTMFPPYAHVYAPPHSASHPLITNHPSMLQRSPATTSDENDEPATATTSTMTTTVATTTALRISTPSTDDKDSYEKNNNNDRFCLDMALKREASEQTSERSRKSMQLSEDGSTECSPEREVACPPPQDDPIDLSMKAVTVATPVNDRLQNEIDDEIDNVSDAENSAAKKPIDLTTRS